MRTIERNSSVPVWTQIFMDLRQQIVTGRLPNGTKLPSEHDLADRYGVSRVTIRYALKELTQDGHLERRHGVGTFVRAKKPVRHDLSLTTPWRILLEEAGHEVSTLVTRNEKVSGPSAEVMQLAGDAVTTDDDLGPAILVERVQMIDQEPLAISQSWVPEGNAPSLAGREPLTDHSLSLTLKRDYGLRSDYIDNQISIQLTTLYESELLGCMVDEPVLAVTAVARQESNLIQLSRTAWLSSRVNFRQVREGHSAFPGSIM